MNDSLNARPVVCPKPHFEVNAHRMAQGSVTRSQLLTEVISALTYVRDQTQTLEQSIKAAVSRHVG